MSNINGLHDSLDSTFNDRMNDILAVKESANRIADGVEELRSYFEEHEVRVYNNIITHEERMFLVSLSMKTAWRGSVEGIRNRLTQGLGQLSNQFSKTERGYDYDCGLSPTRMRHEVLSTHTIYVELIL
jgi:hypothetical protein